MDQRKRPTAGVDWLGGGATGRSWRTRTRETNYPSDEEETGRRDKAVGTTVTRAEEMPNPAGALIVDEEVGTPEPGIRKVGRGVPAEPEIEHGSPGGFALPIKAFTGAG